MVDFQHDNTAPLNNTPPQKKNCYIFTNNLLKYKFLYTYDIKQKASNIKVKQTEQVILGYIDFNKYHFYINYIYTSFHPNFLTDF